MIFFKNLSVFILLVFLCRFQDVHAQKRNREEGAIAYSGAVTNDNEEGRGKEEAVTIHKKKFICEVAGCGKFYTDRANLIRHRRTKHEGREYFCGVAGCNKKYRDSSKLIRHKQVKHGNVIYQCDQEGCNRICSTAKALEKHIALAHRYYCPAEGCGKSYKTADSLRKHTVAHKVFG